MVLASKFFIPMRKSVPQDLIKSHRLLLRAGMVSQMGSGLFTWLPLGLRVLEKVKAIVRKHHNAMGFSECLAPVLHPSDLWVESGRNDVYGEEMMRLTDRHKRELILGPTAEEVFVDILRRNVVSANDLPINVYNIQDKFRDEIRPRFGLMRAREFLMSDAYSFHADEETAMEFYHEVHDGYIAMFGELGFTPIPILQSDTGEIGGKVSHEFFATSETGEVEISFNSAETGEMTTCRGIELGHIFLLGTKYTEAMSFQVDHASGKIYPQMGCYGVGVSRLVAAYLEIYGKDDRIEWPESVAPFAAHIISTPTSREFAEKLHVCAANEIYHDDTDASFGEKYSIADLIGAPTRIVVGNKEVSSGFALVNNKPMSFAETEALCRSLKK